MDAALGNDLPREVAPARRGSTNAVSASTVTEIAAEAPYIRHRTLTKANIDDEIAGFARQIACLGASLDGMRGLELCRALKRTILDTGPYLRVSFYEAANRVMTDLVILHGVRALLADARFPYRSYTVEFGHENNNDHDILAGDGAEALIGEAFNVSRSFYPVKKSKALQKLRTSAKPARIRLLMYNHDAVSATYRPKPQPTECHVMVDIQSGSVRVVFHKR